MLTLVRTVASKITPNWPWWAAGTSVFMLAAAHYFETFQHLAPCTLCLKQREVYWTALAVSAVAIALRFTPWRARTERLLNGALGLIFLVGMGIAIWHVGAEWKWWPGPAACASTGSAGKINMDDLAAALAGGKLAKPSCDEAVWWFLGLSMAGWNVIISAKLAAWSAVSTLRKPADV